MIKCSKAAVIFAAGIYLYNRIAVSFVLIFIISLFMVLTIKALFKHKFHIKILIYTIIFSSGVLLCSYAMSENHHDLSVYIGRYVTLTGRVSRIPEGQEETSRYVVDVKKAVHDGNEFQINDRVLLTSYSALEYGDTVDFSGFIELMPEKMNENGFDYALYYKTRGIFFKIYSKEAVVSDEKIKDFSPLSINLHIKNFVSKVIDSNYSGDYNAMLKAILIGNKKEFSDDFDKMLMRTGMKRFFYPAFIHVTIFMTAITFILGFISRRKRDIILVAVLIIYSMFNFNNAVFIKLALLIAVIIYTKVRKGYVYYPDALGTAVIIIGIVNPVIYYDLGFIMSVLSGVLIHFFYDFVYKFTKFARFKYIRHSITLSIICTVCLLPVSACFFGYISPYSVLFAMLAIPSVAAILVLSPLLIFMLAVFHTAPVIQQFIRCVMFILKNTVVAADKLNIVNMVVPKAGFIFIASYTLFIIAAVNYIRRNTAYAKMSAFTAAALMSAFIISQAMRIGSLEITFVNVGQGDGAVIKAPYDFNVLIDGGGGTVYSDYNPGEKVYLEYIETEGITKADSVFVSHYHQDHVQGIIAAIENLHVRNLFMPDCMEDNEWRAALEKTAKENGTKIHYISEETVLTYRNGMTIRIIPPPEITQKSSDENDTSLVYYVEYKDFSVVFTGDMTQFAERNLINTGKVHHADVLKTAHHGSENSTCEEWLDAVSPEYAVISVGEDNTYALPDDDMINRLEKRDIEIFRTDYDGDIRFTVQDYGKYDIETFDRR